MKILDFKKRRMVILNKQARLEGYPDIMNLVNDFFGKRICLKPRSKKQLYKVLFTGEAYLMKRVCSEYYFSKEIDIRPKVDPRDLREIVFGYSSKKISKRQREGMSQGVGVFRTDYGDVLINRDVAEKMGLKECERSQMSISHRMLLDLFS